MAAELYDRRPCELGEGVLWHPAADTLFWFDIPGKRLLSRGAGGAREWQFDEMHSAAAWVDASRLVVAHETGLSVLDFETGERTALCTLPGAGPTVRTNDGRGDPQGGFWFSTIGRPARPEAGAIWRWYGGQLRRLFAELKIPNAICFAPGGDQAYFADTSQRCIWRVALDAAGWPKGSPERFIDLSEAGLNPDGAVVDELGQIWIAMWGAACVAVFDPEGAPVERFPLPVPNATCPAFGGPDLRDVFVTTARQGLDTAALRAFPASGCVFRLQGISRGRPEPPVRLTGF